jgi:glutamyl-Q tRNA(Asp) synthetase
MEVTRAGLKPPKQLVSASPIIGRFAPSPTGPLHLGSLVAALGSYLHCKAQGGHWLVRIEDIDPPREIKGATDAILQALQMCGLHADAEIIFQSQRLERYRTVLNQLIDAGLAFPCFCSRSQLAGKPHRGRCQHKNRLQPSWRVLVPDVVIAFDDQLQGRFQQHLAQDVGDFILWRSDDWPSYQLACVIDDADSGVTEIVRGADLLDSTPRQIYLQQVLAFPQPEYLHLPLVLGSDGAKLSKQNLAPALALHNAQQELERALEFLGQPKVQSNHIADWLAQAVQQWRVGQSTKALTP